MTEMLPMVLGWTFVERPLSLFRRFEFGAYAETRAFLDRLADLSKITGLYPDLGFGPKHVNVTLYAADGGVPGKAELDFAREAARLADPAGS